MHFIDFLPDLSLVYIIWTFVGAVSALLGWIIIYLLYKTIPKSLLPIRLEYLIFIFIFVVIPISLKRVFFSNFSISHFIGINRILIISSGFVIAAVFYWFIRKDVTKYIVKTLEGLNSRITPLVWFFIVLLVIALPCSLLSNTPSNNNMISGSNDLSKEYIKSSTRPNIILVIFDSLTSHNMQLYGYERPTTPFLTEWAKSAIVFNKVYSASNWTTPATLSLMTGQRVWTHRVWNDVFYRPVNNVENSLPKTLKDNGYDTYSFVQNRYAHPYTLGIQDAFLKKDKYQTFWLPHEFWFNKLTDLLLDRPIAHVWIVGSFFANYIDSYRPFFHTTYATPEIVFNNFLDYISKEKQNRSQKPYFAWLHLWAPHFEYLPPNPYSGFFGDGEKFNSNQQQWSNFTFNKEYDPEKQADIDILKKRYDEFILYCDKEFELFLSRLGKVTDLSNTIIILSADHGESFSHNFLGHAGPHLYAPLVDIPLIIKMPEEINGKILDMPVEQIDIAPTILELAKIPTPEWMEGRSLSSLIEGNPLDPRPIYSVQFRTNRSFGHLISKGSMAVWEGDYKLVYYLDEKKSLLFNLKLDPDETDNIFYEEPVIGNRLLSLINSALDSANKNMTIR
ncbi:MAG: sulfatase-like hydrolase/transferase [Thermodesulfovibrionia bacterium]|nr:sulfatase-like hydrolase/transferase [Thermodesulfovibrionia bacterium]